MFLHNNFSRCRIPFNTWRTGILPIFVCFLILCFLLIWLECIIHYIVCCSIINYSPLNLLPLLRRNSFFLIDCLLTRFIKKTTSRPIRLAIILYKLKQHRRNLLFSELLWSSHGPARVNNIILDIIIIINSCWQIRINISLMFPYPATILPVSYFGSLLW